MKWLIFIIIVASFLACSKKQPTKLQQAVIELEAELHSGQGKDDVIEILKAKNIEHTYDQDNRQIIAIIRNVNSNLTSSKSTQIIVSLNEMDTVRTVVFKDIYTGL